MLNVCLPGNLSILASEQSQVPNPSLLNSPDVRPLSTNAARTHPHPHPCPPRYYRRLLQMGVTNTELWANMGLCCFYASQYDMALGCFERALQLADDANAADVWYNLSHVRGLDWISMRWKGFGCLV